MGRRGRKRRLDIESEYWLLLASGVGTVEACKQLGIGRKTGYRWRAENGGLPPAALSETMRDVADLREAMARETADLVPRPGAEEIVRAGRRRRAVWRTAMVAASAGAAVLALAVPVAVRSVGGGERGDTSAAITPPAGVASPTPDASPLDCPNGPSPRG